MSKPVTCLSREEEKPFDKLRANGHLVQEALAAAVDLPDQEGEERARGDPDEEADARLADDRAADRSGDDARREDEAPRLPDPAAPVHEAALAEGAGEDNAAPRRLGEGVNPAP